MSQKDKSKVDAEANPAAPDAATGPVGDTADPSPDASPDQPADPLAAVTAERDRLHNQLQRTLADLQNFRKRRAQEMADVRLRAIEAVASELLPVLDNFHLATTYGNSTGEAAAQSMQDGLMMVKGMLEGVFERHGVLEIPAEGVQFDPNVHEAVGIDPDPAAAEGVVTKVLQKGYRIDTRVIRPTRVMVGGAPAGSSEVEPGGEATPEQGES